MAGSASRALSGRHAVVTGGGQGIGAAVAAELAEWGAMLSLLGRTERTLREQAERLAALGVRVAVARCDVADEASVRRAFTEVRAANGPVDILVNNAGQAESATLTETTPVLWNRMLAVNLTGTFLCTAAVLPEMIERGWGRIVNVASTAGLKGYTRLSAYCAAKHGVIGLTRATALETAKVGVTVNAVCPGYTDTRIVADAIRNVSAGMQTSAADAEQMLLRVIPRRRFTTPEEVAGLVGWLCLPEAAAVTGVAIPVAGGEVT